MRDACDIDKLRDLVHRQHDAKRRCYQAGRFSEHTGERLDSAEVERQLNTYISQGTTVVALTKCVDRLEAEAQIRVKNERERDEARRHDQRILRIARNGMSLIKNAKLTDYDYRPSLYVRDRELRKREFVQECEEVIKWVEDNA